MAYQTKRKITKLAPFKNKGQEEKGIGCRGHFSAAAVISRYCFKKPLDLYEMIIVIIAIKTRFGYVAQYDETKINVILLPISSL